MRLRLKVTFQGA